MMASPPVIALMASMTAYGWIDSLARS